MRSFLRHSLGAVAVSAVATVASAQSVTGKPPAAATPPPTVPGYVVSFEITALSPEVKGAANAGPEARLLGALKNVSNLKSRVHLSQDLSRQEIVSTDFILPAGTLVMHKGGDRFYVLADPKARTYHVMDSTGLLSALEGGAGIVNSAYDAKVQHTEEKRMIAGLPARKSLVTVTYASAIPLENDRVLVQQKNELEVWHTSALVSSAALDHLFFKFQKDKTGVVQKALQTEIGFPLEVKFVVTQAGTGKRSQDAQPGSFHMVVTDVKQDKRLDSGLFFIPPPDFRRLDRNPYFAAAASGSGGSRP